ncbi:MAG TPA: hypothetical protein VMP11_13090 [Verrucomicrobiae bacterium]|nr:hypothetical protein [Verrucomicrobiae bacterium]
MDTNYRQIKDMTYVLEQVEYGPSGEEEKETRRRFTIYQKGAYLQVSRRAGEKGLIDMGPNPTPIDLVYDIRAVQAHSKMEFVGVDKAATNGIAMIRILPNTGTALQAANGMKILLAVDVSIGTPVRIQSFDSESSNTPVMTTEFSAPIEVAKGVWIPTKRTERGVFGFAELGRTEVTLSDIKINTGLPGIRFSGEPQKQ